MAIQCVMIAFIFPFPDVIQIANVVSISRVRVVVNAS